MKATQITTAAENTSPKNKNHKKEIATEEIAKKNFYEKYSPVVYGFIWRIVKQKDLARKIYDKVINVELSNINYSKFIKNNDYKWLIGLAKEFISNELEHADNIINNNYDLIASLHTNHSR